MIRGRANAQDGHWIHRDAGREFGRVIGAVGRGGGDDIADRDLAGEGHDKTSITFIAGDHSLLPQVELPLPAPKGVAGGIRKELEAVGAAGFAIQRPANTGAGPADGLGQHWVVLCHIGPGPGTTHGIRIDPKGTQINAQGTVGKDGIAKNCVVDTPVPDAHTRINRLGESDAVASGTANCVIVGTDFALH